MSRSAQSPTAPSSAHASSQRRLRLGLAVLAGIVATGGVLVLVDGAGGVVTRRLASIAYGAFGAGGFLAVLAMRWVQPPAARRGLASSLALACASALAAMASLLLVRRLVDATGSSHGTVLAVLVGGSFVLVVAAVVALSTRDRL